MSGTAPEAAARLKDDGFVTLDGVISPRWLQHLSRALDEALARPSPLGRQLARSGGAFFSDLYLSMSFPAFRCFTEESGIGARIAAITGLDRVVLFTDELLVKEPLTAHETPWHHDHSYWPLEGREIYSVWIPLDGVTASTGALEFVRGSHLWSQRFCPSDFDSGAVRMTRADEQPVPDIDAVVEPADRVVAAAEPGDCVVFHSLTLHRASGNGASDRRRRAVVLRLVGPDVRYDPRPRTLPLLWAPRLAPGQVLGEDPMFPTLHPARA